MVLHMNWNEVKKNKTELYDRDSKQMSKARFYNKKQKEKETETARINNEYVMLKNKQ